MDQRKWKRGGRGRRLMRVPDPVEKVERERGERVNGERDMKELGFSERREKNRWW